ncbi:MAG TPA: ATP-dependent metallopeptidase FtsH/Yme1/Tma family protein, partial [Thermoleophilaceae bacterium]|nr:ATP-dependent metallopeptidase FtsH/Yme1/Tma family protein [Thermoleophilaceae bacterium]
MKGSRTTVIVQIALALLVVLAIAQLIGSSSGDEPTPSFTDFLAQVERGEVERVDLDTGDNTIAVTPVEGAEYETAYPDNTEQNLINNLRAEDITIAVEGKGGSALGTILIFGLPFLLFVFLWLFLIRRMMGGGSQLMKMGKSKAKLQSPEQPKITFRDVAGVDEAVEELHEIKEFLE